MYVFVVISLNNIRAWYDTHWQVGEALAAVLAEGVVRREDVFVTSKLWNSDHGRGRVEAACRKSIEDLRVRGVLERCGRQELRVWIGGS